MIELWDDIDEISEENGELKKHYTGTIYLEEIHPQDCEKWLSGVKFYDVVDGQQRLATLSIFIFELLSLTKSGFCGETQDDLFKTYIRKTNASKNSTVYKFSYAHTDRNYNFLLKKIFEDDNIIVQDNHLNVYTKNLLEAKGFFQKKLKDLPVETLELIYRKLTTSLQFDIRTIDEKDIDVQAVFETMNNRGKPLSTLEKLKNRLIYLSTKLKESGEDKTNLRKKINDAWGKIYGVLAQNPNMILDEDVFLSAHLSLYRKPSEAVFSENLAEKKVFEMFCNKSDKYDKDNSGEKEEVVSYKKIEDYILRLSDSAPVWYKIHNSDCKEIKKILLLSGSKEVKVFLLAFMLSAEYHSHSSEILNSLEKILFRNKVPGIGVIDERTTASWGRDLYQGEDTVIGIKTRLSGLVNTPVSNQNLIQAITYLYSYERGAKGFHRWGALKYFLFEYEEYLKLKARETNDKVDLEEFDSTTIEHIIPTQFWDNWSQMMNSFTKEFDPDDRGIAYKIILNTLGNLTILKNGKNSSLGNASWTVKKDRYKTGSYNEIAVSQQLNWTENEAYDRGIDMLSFLESKIEGLTLSEDDKKKLLLSEDFIINKLFPVSNEASTVI